MHVSDQKHHGQCHWTRWRGLGAHDAPGANLVPTCMAIRATYRHTIFEELCDALWASLSAQVHALGNPLARGDYFQEKTRQNQGGKVSARTVPSPEPSSSTASSVATSYIAFRPLLDALNRFGGLATGAQRPWPLCSGGWSCWRKLDRFCHFSFGPFGPFGGGPKWA